MNCSCTHSLARAEQNFQFLRNEGRVGEGWNYYKLQVKHLTMLVLTLSFVCAYMCMYMFTCTYMCLMLHHM